MPCYTATHLKKITLAFALVLFGLLSLQVHASKGGELVDKTRIVSLSPEQLSAIKGGRISGYSLAAVSGGRMNPIPYQFDERTQSGYIYMKNLDEKLQEEDPILGMEGYFDENDELIFMFKDAGPRRKRGMSSDGKIISEIELLGYDNQRRYVYLVEGARLESENYYVRFSAELGRVETDYYALQVDPGNAFMWKEFYYDSFDGAHPRKPVDTIKLEMKANAFAALPQTLTNKNLVAKPIAEKSGPIRSTTQYKLTLTYMHVPMLAMKLQIVHHEYEIVYDALTEIPAVRRRLIGKPSMVISLDGYDLLGASLRAQNGPTEPAIVDGKISDIEKQIMETPTNLGEMNWLWMDSHYNFMVFCNYAVTGDNDIPLGIFVNDDAEMEEKSGYYKGSLPNLGFTIPRIPLIGTMRIYVELKMFNEELDIKVDKFAEMLTREDKIKVFNM